MSENRLDINALQEIAHKSLEVVQQILGIETYNICAQNELEPYVDAHSIHSNKNFTASELIEQKHYLIEEQRYLTKKYA